MRKSSWLKALTFWCCLFRTTLAHIDDSESNKEALAQRQLQCVINGIRYCQTPVPAPTAVPIYVPAPVSAAPVSLAPIPGTAVYVPTTRSPTRIPTAAPIVPPVTPAPTSRPTIKPTQRPTTFPTRQPTTRPPKTFPTRRPTATPTKRPSAMPTGLPTAGPTGAPTSLPSGTPTVTTAPTVSANGFTTNITIGDDGFPQAISTCRNAIPTDATNVTNQLIAFHYVLNIVPSSSAPLSISTITMRLQNELSKTNLNCDYSTKTSAFYTYAISSRPGDVLANATCSKDQRVDGTKCYLVNGAFTVTTFYRSRHSRRRLAAATATNTSVIQDSDVLSTYTSSLQDIFASGVFDSSTVKSTSFLGVTNSGVASSSNSNKALIAGSVVGGFVALGVIVALAILLVSVGRRRCYDEELKEQNSLSLYVENDDVYGARALEGPRDDQSRLTPVIFRDEESTDEEDPWLSSSPKSEYSRPPQPAVEDDAFDEVAARAMLTRVKEDLGPRTQPASPRRYDVHDTVDL